MTKQEVLAEVKRIEEKTGSIIDAIIEVCEKYSIDVDTIARYIKYSKDIKERVRFEGEALNMLKV